MAELSEDRMVEMAKFASDLLNANVAPRQVEKDLVAQGVDAEKAAQIVAQVSRFRAQRPEEPDRGAGGADIMLGIVLIAVGIGITVFTYMAAANGGTYVVAFGPIGWGLWRLVRGATRN